MSSIFKKIISVAIACTALSSAIAGSWDMLSPFKGPKKNVVTLVVTANYKHPLILAQLIQKDTEQPYLLLPAANSKGIFFNPPIKRQKAALEIREANLERFIRFLNPKQVVILGDKRYVSEKYRKMIHKDIPVIRITGNNWQRVADRLSILLEASNVGSDYKKLSSEIDSDLYKPTAPAAPEAKDEVPADLAEEIVIEEGKEADKAKETPLPEMKAAPKEPQPVMPKATPSLIKDK